MIKVYTTPNCVQCRMVKKVLTDNNVKFESIDLSQDEKSMTMVKSLGYSAAPVVISDEDHFAGFRLEKIKDFIDKEKAKVNR